VKVTLQATRTSRRARVEPVLQILTKSEVYRASCACHRQLDLCYRILVWDCLELLRFAETTAARLIAGLLMVRDDITILHT
jgi:hypothetical protein